MKILRDSDFERSDVPMTKYIQRALAMALLEIGEGDVLLDIGLGTGTISVQAALMGAKVYGIDKNPSAVALSKKNAKNHQVQIHASCGLAPEDLEDIKINKCFIGGSGKNLKNILVYLEENLEPGGIVLASFIISDNAVEFKNLLKEFGYMDIETRLIQVAEENDYKMMMGQNPIYMIRGVKND